jgi:hypothetical protein
LLLWAASVSITEVKWDVKRANLQKSDQKSKAILVGKGRELQTVTGWCSPVSGGKGRAGQTNLYQILCPEQGEGKGDS